MQTKKTFGSKHVFPLIPWYVNHLKSDVHAYFNMDFNKVGVKTSFDRQQINAKQVLMLSGCYQKTPK